MTSQKPKYGYIYIRWVIRPAPLPPNAVTKSLRYVSICIYLKLVIIWKKNMFFQFYPTTWSFLVFSQKVNLPLYVPFSKKITKTKVVPFFFVIWRKIQAFEKVNNFNSFVNTIFPFDPTTLHFFLRLIFT